jgi:hypothetical protein
MTHTWWQQIEDIHPGLLTRPVYFISSNTHSLANIISGFAIKKHRTLVQFLEEFDDGVLLREWVDIQAEMNASNQENFFYYVLKKFLQSSQGRDYRKAHLEHEYRCGITQIKSKHLFDVTAQVIDLSQISSENIDHRLSVGDLSFIKYSNALILNIDYPLGSEHVRNIMGVYIMGKAATLNGGIGDVMVPNIVYDAHSRNQYIFQNAFTAVDVEPFLEYGTALDNQKAVTVRGTFLQNAEYMNRFYRKGYTDIEMEAGPFLSAILIGIPQMKLSTSMVYLLM